MALVVSFAVNFDLKGLELNGGWQKKMEG